MIDSKVVAIHKQLLLMMEPLWIIIKLWIYLVSPR